MAARRAKLQVRRFDAKGERLWASLEALVDGERGLVLLEEACRIADRLDKLDGLLSGSVDVWCRVTEDRAGDLAVTVDSALIEARQQAGVLRLLLAGLPMKGSANVDDPDDWLADITG